MTTAFRLPKALTLDELEALRSVPKNERDQALIETMAGCGLRVSEACNLKLDEVYWSSDTPSLRFIGKRDKERVVPMNHQVQDELRSWLDLRGVDKSNYVFCNLHTGARLSRKTVWDALKRYSQRAGIRHVHPHMLRHTFGTVLADRGEPVHGIRVLMGHASIQTSQIYISVSAEQKRHAVERIDQRHRLVRWISRQRNRSYRFFGKPKRNSVFTRGETVGRQEELKELQAHVDKGIDTLLVGPVGMGKSHLLELLEGDYIIRIKSLSPTRQAIMAIAEELHRKGDLKAASSGEGAVEEDRACSPAEQGEAPQPAGKNETHDERRDESEQAMGGTPDPDFEAIKKLHTRTSVAGWTQMVIDSIEKDQYALAIDDLSDLTTSTGRLIDKLADQFLIVAALHEVKKAHEKHFWKFERIEVGPLSSGDARTLIRQAAAGADIEDARMFETHLLAKTAGNPRAILESVARLKKEPAVTRNAVRELTHSGARSQFDLTPIIIVPVLCLVVFRFVARGMDNMEFYLLAGIGSALAMFVRYFLFRAQRR
ncbi:MAG: tyrosine-type recombinase/integrase [Proteobacteria bacterium]|jgi:integrase/recombinase XerD|nr:tyrosine-type recombinase/integrase [Pseudomonadota bacterium]